MIGSWPVFVDLTYARIRSVQCGFPCMGRVNRTCIGYDRTYIYTHIFSYIHIGVCMYIYMCVSICIYVYMERGT